MPEAAVAVVDEHQIVALEGVDTAAVLVNPAAQVVGGRGQFQRVAPLGGSLHQRGSSLSLGTLLQPQQPSVAKHRFFQARRASHHQRCR
jgi:hypothetical protein